MAFQSYFSALTEFSTLTQLSALTGFSTLTQLSTFTFLLLLSFPLLLRFLLLLIPVNKTHLQLSQQSGNSGCYSRHESLAAHYKWGKKTTILLTKHWTYLLQCTLCPLALGRVIHKHICNSLHNPSTNSSLAPSSLRALTREFTILHNFSPSQKLPLVDPLLL